MKYSFNFCFLTIILLFIVGYQPVNGAIRYHCPEKEIKELEVLLDSLIGFGKVQRKFPTNNEESKKFCGKARKDITRLDRLFKTCFDGTAKNFVTVLLYSFNASVKTYCNPKNKRKFNDFIEMSKCVNKPEAKKAIASEVAIYIDTIQRAKLIKPPKDGVGHACCDYFKLMSNVERKLEKPCLEKEGQIAVEFMRNLIQSLIDMGCGDYIDGSDTCSKLKALPKKRKGEKKYGSFLLPLVDFWNNFD